MKKMQKIEAIDTLRDAKSLIRQLAAGNLGMTLEYYTQVLVGLDALSLLLMKETKE